MVPLYQKKSEPKTLGTDGNQCIQGISCIIHDGIFIPPSDRFDSEQIVEACVAIAGSRDSISGFQFMHHGLLSHTTCLRVLHELNMDELVKSSSKMLLSAADTIIRRNQKYNFAIDIVKEPYYGEREGEYSNYIIGGQRKASTNYFFWYLTLYICNNEQRITLLAIPWTRESSLLVGVITCVELIQRLRLKIKSLCMDREFYVTSIFEYLQKEDIPCIVPVKEAGAELKKLMSGDKFSIFTYTMKKNTPEALDVTICECVVYLKGKRGKHGKVHHAFVIYGVPHSCFHIRKTDSHRFGIESSYRMKNIPKVKTCSKDPRIRYFYTLISYLYQNIWIQIQWNRFATVQRGPKVVLKNKFQFKHLISIIQAEIENIFLLRCIDEIAIT